MVVSAVGQTGEVPGFADRLGERLVVAQPSGALLEFLHFHPELSSAPFFEPALKSRLKRLSNFRHAAYARATRLQRDPARGNRLALVSAYTPGRRLADVMALARRGRLQPRIAAVLSLTRQLMTGVALLHDYAPDVFHGAIGPERLVVGPDGRVVITEYVLGEAVEQAVPQWGSSRLWREFRVATLGDTSLTRFGRRLDLIQVGIVTLSLLVGRPLSAAEFPDGLRDLVEGAHETTAEGESVPVGAAFKDWLTRILYIEPASAFRTLVEAQKAFVRMVDEEPRYGVSSLAVETFFQQCEEAALLPVPPGEVEAAEAADHDAAQPAAQGLEAQAVQSPVGGSTGGGERGGSDGDDPFGPWPVSIGRDSAATLLDSLAPQESTPGLALAERHPLPDAPRGEDSQEAGERRDADTDWMGLADTTDARKLRETILEVQETPRQVEQPEIAPLVAPPIVDPPMVTPAHEWALSAPPPPSGPAPKVEVVLVEPLPATLPASAGPADEKRPASGAVRAAGERKAAPVVLSYDEVHNRAEKPRSRMLLVAAVVVVIGVVSAIGGPRVWSSFRGGAKDAATQTTTAAVSGDQLGGFRITTQPPGGRITIDGKARGAAPLRVADLAPGLHSITVESEWGTIDEAVTVEAGKVTPLALATVGWIKIASPVELHVSEQGKAFGTTGKGPVMVPAGRHHFDLVNQAVAVRLRQFVEVPPGQTVSVPVELPAGMLNLSSDQPAQVLIDGQTVGETPIVSMPTTLGSHEVIFRSAKYGEVSYTVNVTLAAPVRLSVSFAKR